MKKIKQKEVTTIEITSNNKGRKLEGKELEEHLKAFTDIGDCIRELYKNEK